MSLGLHVLGDRVRSAEEMYAAVRDIGGKYHVIVNNAGLAARVLLLPDRPTVIYRRWRNDHNNPGDNNAQNHYSAADFVRRMDEEAPTGAMLNLGNEPECQTPAHWKKLGDWTFAALEEAERRNRKCAIFNLPTWNPPAEMWRDPTIKRCLDRALAGGHVIGLHMYWGVDGNKDPFGGRNFPENIGRWQDLRAVSPNITIVATEMGYCHEFKPQVGYVGKMTDDQYADGLERVAKHWAAAGIHGCIFAIGSESDDWGSFSVRPRVVQRMAAYNATETSVPIVPLPTTDYWLRPVVAPYVITSSFGPRENVAPKDHKGVDYVPPAPYLVRAARGGVVSFAGADNTGFGNLIKLDHGDGWESLYAHLASFAPGITKGVAVRVGQQLGIAGSTGNSTALHLHWELRRNGVPVDPALYNVVADIPTPTPPVVVPPTPQPETPDTPPAFEVEFATPAEKDHIADIGIQLFQLIKAHPGRRIEITVKVK